MDVNLYNQLIEYLTNHSLPPEINDKQRQQLRQKANHYIVLDNILYKRNMNGEPLRVITKDNLTKLLYNMHSIPNAGHFGIRATIEKTRQRYFWPTMGEDIRNYIETCDTC